MNIPSWKYCANSIRKHIYIIIYIFIYIFFWHCFSLLRIHLLNSQRSLWTVFGPIYQTEKKTSIFQIHWPSTGQVLLGSSLPPNQSSQIHSQSFNNLRSCKLVRNGVDRFVKKTSLIHGPKISIDIKHIQNMIISKKGTSFRIKGILGYLC